MNKLRMLSLCSGIGGADLAAEATGGIEVVGQVENDPFCQAVLAKHWPHVLCMGDANGGCSTQSNQAQLCYMAAPQPGENLNPEWVEAMMGLPAGWTAIDGLPCQEKPSTKTSRRARSQKSSDTEISA